MIWSLEQRGDPKMQTTTFIEKIGSFKVVDEKCVIPFAVIDCDEFNNWGKEFFRTQAEATAYAAWAHAFKIGRTDSEFKF
jgi:hypothetical protein